MNSPTISPPRLSNATFASSFQVDGKRHKESSFLFKHGQRHHSYDSEKAPYPVSYDRAVLELDSMDDRLVLCTRNSMSFVDFKDGPPTRSLDLGCGNGNWVVGAAKEWPNCEFVGFDLVNVQIPLKYVEPSIAQRVTWVHGNFLTTKLPFEDDEFDYVHVKSISRGVPENKWGVLFEEINRVLRPGGVVEVCEDDILFPLLPRWFTAPLRVQTLCPTSAHFPDNSHPANTPQTNVPAHDHALLESLYQSIFESRFINLRPTAVVPGYFTIYFRHVVLGPVTNFPMPPLPPLQPLPPQIVSSYATSEILASTADIPPSTRPASMSFSSTISHSTSTSTAVDSTTSSLFNGSETAHEHMDTCSAKPILVVNEDDSSISANRPSAHSSFTNPEFEPSLGSGVSVSSPLPNSMQGTFDEVSALSQRSMAMHLYRAYQSVLACQEAMWEELKDRLRNKKDDLTAYGWDDDLTAYGWDDDEEVQNRKKFERLVERYRGDMQSRVSLWCSLCGLGWALPSREPLSKAELIEEERIHRGMLEARHFASKEDHPALCRTGRVLVGYKDIDNGSV